MTVLPCRSGSASQVSYGHAAVSYTHLDVYKRQHAGRRKTGVIDERGVAVTLPFNGIGRIGDDGLEGFIIINQIDALLGKIAVFLSQSNYLTPQTPD